MLFWKERQKRIALKKRFALVAFFKRARGAMHLKDQIHFFHPNWRKINDSLFYKEWVKSEKKWKEQSALFALVAL